MPNKANGFDSLWKSAERMKVSKRIMNRERKEKRSEGRGRV